MRLETGSAAATAGLGAAIAPLLRPGDTVVLAGDLGAGKTTFTRGVARALGVEGDVTSPTFTIVHEYGGTVPVVHVDLYRLERLQEVHDIGFDELVGGDAVLLVEWGDLLGPLLPVDRLQLTFEYHAERDDARVVEIATHGPAWVARRDGLADAVAAFGVD